MWIKLKYKKVITSFQDEWISKTEKLEDNIKTSTIKQGVQLIELKTFKELSIILEDNPHIEDFEILEK